MNPWLLWIPGSALIVVGAIALAVNALSLVPAVAVMILGSALESVGVLLWVRGRQRKDPT